MSETNNPEPKNIEIQPLANKKFIKPQSLYYQLGEKEKRWDLVKSHDSVAILLFEPNEAYFLLVKQFRPPVYLNDTDGYTYELCAGIVDKDKSLVEIIYEEAIEECGITLDQSKIQKITSFYTVNKVVIPTIKII